MMNQRLALDERWAFIRIERHPHEDPHCVNLVVTASNGPLRGEIEIYDDASCFAELANKLRGFPKDRSHEVVWKLGSAEA
jgi:hypothetical protein